MKWDEVSYAGCKNKLLVRHPSPFSTESLFGYFLRLSQANGFSSPWTLFRRAGLHPYQIRGPGIKVEKISAIIHCSPAQLGSIAHSCPDTDRFFRLLNHPLVPSDLDLGNPRLCSACIQEKGYIEAHWDLKFMIGCSVHSHLAVNSCPKCLKPVSWYRPGLLRCKCGAKLQNSEAAPISVLEASLLEVLRSKVLGLLPFADFGAGLPIRELFGLELRSLMTLIAVLGNCRNITNRSHSDNSGERTVVSSAAYVLCDWPNNFFELLKILGSRRRDQRQNMRQQFAPLYTALLKRKPGKGSEEMDFVRIAFRDFVSNHWGGRCADAKLMKHLHSQVSRRFISRTQLAQSMGIDLRTVSRWSAQLVGTPPAASNGAHAAVVIDANRFSFRAGEPCKVLTMRRAAASIGIPVEVLRALKATGDFEVKQLLQGQRGFHELDVRLFVDRLVGAASSAAVPNKDEHGNTIALGTILQGRVCSTQEKASIIRGLILAALEVIPSSDGTVRDIRISLDQFHRFISRHRLAECGNVITCSAAAKRLGCDCETIRGLIANKLLDANRSNQSWKIQQHSVDEFRKTYVPTSSIAKEVRTSSRRIVELCSERSIDLLLVQVPNKGIRPFVRRDTISLLSKEVRGRRPVSKELKCNSSLLSVKYVG